MPELKYKYNLALALGGGGARGVAHIGVLKILEREGIVPDLIVGTSMGAIIGGMYAQLKDVSAVEEKALTLIDQIVKEKRWIQVLSRQKDEAKQSLLAEFSNYVQRRYIGFKALTQVSLEPKESLHEPLKKLLFDNNLEDTKIPFAAVCLDLYNGETRVLTTGSIIDAVYASSAIEGIFPPLEYEGGYLADGGPTNITPVEIAGQLDSRYVIAVDVYQKIRKLEQLNNGLDIIMRADNIGLNRLRQIDLAQASLVISPNVGNIHWANFAKARECIRRGEQAAEMMIPSLKELLKEESWLSRFKTGVKYFFKDLPET